MDPTDRACSNTRPPGCAHQPHVVPNQPVTAVQHNKISATNVHSTTTGLALQSQESMIESPTGADRGCTTAADPPHQVATKTPLIRENA